MLLTVFTVTTLTALGSVVGQATTKDDVCGSSELQDVVNLMRDDLKRVREEVKDVKAVCTCPECSASVDHNNTAAASALTNNCVPILIQQNVDGSDFFSRSWAEFKVGFSSNIGNYWLGNDLLSHVTMSGRYKLRFDLVALNGTRYWAEYSAFRVKNETYNYRLTVGGYSGNTGHDAFIIQNGMEFTTYDRENDLWSGVNCAVRRGGGFWYNHCGWCSVNSGRDVGFAWWNGSGWMKLETSRMWLSCH